jgi:hypothetical protein
MESILPWTSVPCETGALETSVHPWGQAYCTKQRQSCQLPSPANTERAVGSPLLGPIEGAVRAHGLTWHLAVSPAILQYPR